MSLRMRGEQFYYWPGKNERGRRKGKKERKGKKGKERGRKEKIGEGRARRDRAQENRLAGAPATPKEFR